MLHNSKPHPRQDPDIWRYTMDGARDRLHEHGEVITDQTLGDRIVKGLPDDYKYVRTADARSASSGWAASWRTTRLMGAWS